MSRSDFSVEYTRFSALFLTSATSRRRRSSSACDSASFIIDSMSCSLRPLDAVIVIFCSLPVPMSLALDVHDAVGVDVEGDLDLRYAARRRRDADELNLPSVLL